MKKKKRVKQPKLKLEKINVLGEITACFRDGLCDILISKDNKVKGKLSGELRRYLTNRNDRLLVGDKVWVEFGEYDLTLGLIRRIEKNGEKKMVKKNIRQGKQIGLYPKGDKITISVQYTSEYEIDDQGNAIPGTTNSKSKQIIEGTGIIHNLSKMLRNPKITTEEKFLNLEYTYPPHQGNKVREVLEYIKNTHDSNFEVRFPTLKETPPYPIINIGHDPNSKKPYLNGLKGSPESIERLIKERKHIENQQKAEKDRLKFGKKNG